MMYLSRLMLNLRNRAVQRDLADRFELHRTVMSGFDAQLAADERVLFRVELVERAANAPVLVQSQNAPRWDESERLSSTGYLNAAPQIREVNPRITIGQAIRFRLQANPTVKREGKRHGLFGEEKMLDWLARKGELSGFSFDRPNVRVSPLGRIAGKRRQQTWFVAQFDGILTVTDEHFEEALREGLGSGKAFGFGMLSIPYGPSNAA
jgi:CRISPR system Cascade subunit CasE